MSIIVIIAILFSMFSAHTSAAYEAVEAVNNGTDIYLLNGYVAQYEADQVTVWTEDGDEWYYYSNDDSIYEGLKMTLVIDGRHTDDLSDDVILDALYCTDCTHEVD
jgi:hypothetical protein